MTVPIHTLKTGCVITALAGVHIVLRVSSKAQVASTIVKRVKIDMVNVFTSEKFSPYDLTDNCPVHINILRLAVNSFQVAFRHVCTVAAIAFVKRCAPFEVPQISINGANASDLFFGQWDKNRFEGIMSRHAGVPFTLEPSDIQLSRRVFDLPSIITQCG